MLRRLFFGRRPPSRAARHGTTGGQPAASTIPTPAAPSATGYGVLYDAATQQLDAQFSAADALDAKAAAIFSVASMIVAVVPALLPLGRRGIELISWPALFLALGFLGWTAVLLLFWRSYSLGKWAAGPDIDELADYAPGDEEEVRRWAALAYRLAIKANRRGLARKARFTSLTMPALVFEVAMLVAAALATFAR